MVEQGTHKPLVGSSNLPLAEFSMAWMYLSRISGRHYIGSVVDLDARFRKRHLRGHTHTKRLGENRNIASERSQRKEARKIERSLKAKKNPTVAIYHLLQ